jgi:hypothetical protein
MDPESMLERAQQLDLVMNVFREGVNGSYRTIPTKVQRQTCAYIGVFDDGSQRV